MEKGKWIRIQWKKVNGSGSKEIVFGSDRTRILIPGFILLFISSCHAEARKPKYLLGRAPALLIFFLLENGCCVSMFMQPSCPLSH